MADSKPNVDSELDSLLDSALSDFDAQKEKEKQAAAQQADVGVGVESSGDKAAQQPDQTGNLSPPPPLAVDFDQMRESLNSFMKQNPLLGAENGTDDGELARAMQETLGMFTQSLDRFQERGGDFNSDEFLSDVFRGLNVDGAEPFGEFLSHGLDAVLTKQLLYPGLKDIHDSLPKWLEDNRAKIDADELKRVESQQNFVSQIVDEYESESDSDSKEQKSERQRRVLDLLSKLQALGDLPPEVLGKQGGFDLPPGAGTDAVLPECAQQ